MAANQQLVSQLDAAAKPAVVEQCDLHAAYPTTGSLSSVQGAGSFAGMLLQCQGSGPLLHSGCALPLFQTI